MKPEQQQAAREAYREWLCNQTRLQDDMTVPVCECAYLAATKRMQERCDALEAALRLSISALQEAEAILGGEYGDHYQSLCDKMLALEDAARALVGGK